MKIVKRNGQIVNYDPEKIRIAINKANSNVPSKDRISEKRIDDIIQYIESLDKKRMLVEDIQDIIETKLMEYGKFNLAKKYIVYRYTRELVRKKNNSDESILGIIDNDKSFNMDGASQRELIANAIRNGELNG